jgi:hypothetical protein
MIAARTNGQPRRLIQIPPECSVLSEAPFKTANSLVGHPLFEDARIKRLLRTLPRERIEIRGVQSLGTNDGSYKRGPMLADADPIDTFERLAEKPTWMLLHEAWIHDPDFAQLLKDYVRDLQETFQDLGDDLSDLGCWVFLSSGKCVVHFHADPDQSFLNQVRGSKTAFVYPARLVPEDALEKLVYTEDQNAVTYRSEYEAEMFPPAHLNPGESVFLPLYAPHRVTNDDGISVSLNVGFNTRHSRRCRKVRLFNLELRQMGLHPSPYDRHPVVDTMKERMHLAFRAKNKFFKSLRPSVKV